jgi:AcrR family transcriptional regulator
MARERRRTQAERNATANRRLIRAAMRLIARQGYTRTTLAEVGAAAGYTAGLVSHYFGSKTGLLRALVEHAAGRFYQDQMWPAVEGKSGLDALCTIVDAYLTELVVREERMRALYVLMGEALGPVAEINGAFVEVNRSFRVAARSWIQAGIDAGEIRSDIDPDVEAVAFVGMLRGVGTQWMADRGCFEIDRVRETLKEALHRHLGRKPLPQAVRGDGSLTSKLNSGGRIDARR